MKDNDEFFGCWGKIIFIVLFLVLATAIDGWAFSILWGWFIIPVFESAPTLSAAQAIGMSYVFHALLGNVNRDSGMKAKDASERIIQGVVGAVTRPIMLLLFGWVVLQFV